MEDKITSLKKTARVAGIWYLFLIIIGIYGIIYVPSQIIVHGNTAVTINNILTHQFLFRTDIFASVISDFIFLFLVLILHRLFKQVNERLAKLMVVLVLVQVPISFLLDLLNFTSLMVLKGEVLKAFEPAQKQALAMLFLNIHDNGQAILEVFWGIWLIPFGQLVYKSGFIPRIIGILLILGGVTYMADSFVFLLFPDLDSIVSEFTIVASLGELSITLWLLIMGVKVQKAQ